MAKPFVIDKVFNDILDLIAEGKSVLKACQEFKVSKQSFYDYMETDKSLKDRYTIATQLRGDSAIDRIEEELNNLDMGIADPAKARVKIDTLKWFACKFYPKMYGEKLQQEHSGEITLLSFEDRIKQLRNG